MKKSMLIITLLFLAGNVTQAQIWKNAEKKIGKKIEDKASQRAERKVDKAIDKGLDKVEEAPNQKEAEQKEQKTSDTETTPAPSAPSQAAHPSAPGLNKSNVALPEKYSFTLGITYEVKEDASKSKKGEEMTTWYGEDVYLGMEAEKSMFMVMDIKRNAMVNFMEEGKMYMVISNDFSTALPVGEEDNKTPAGKMPTIEKVGNENILGYDCIIYQVTTDEGVSKVWYTNALKVGYNNFMAAMAQSAKKQNAGASMRGMPEGVMLKMESKEKGSNKMMTMMATAVHKNGKTILVSSYKPMGY